MNHNLLTRMAAGAALMMLMAAPLALGTTYSGNVTGTSPGSATITGVVSGGIAFCQNVAPGPLDCSTGTAGGAFFDVDVYTTTSSNVVNGTCSVAQPVVGVVRDGDLEFMCGSDRDDDTVVTDTDANDEDGVSTDGGIGCFDDVDDNKDAADCAFDDQGWVGNMAASASSASIEVCFVRDTATGATSGGGDWDDITVFIGGTISPPAVPNFYIGAVSISLELNDAYAPSECGDDDL